MASVPNPGDRLTGAQQQRLWCIGMAFATVATVSAATVLVAEAVATLRATQAAFSAPATGATMPRGPDHRVYRTLPRADAGDEPHLAPSGGDTPRTEPSRVLREPNNPNANFKDFFCQRG